LKAKKQRKLIIAVLIVLIIAGAYTHAVYIVPGSITLIQGKEYNFSFKSPLFVNIKADKDGILTLNNQDIKASSYYRLSEPLFLNSTIVEGVVNLQLRLFGFIPLKTVQVYVLPDKQLAACGSTIGVKIDIDGVLVLGTSEVQTADGEAVLPVKESGIKAGDFLREINGRKLSSIDELIDEIQKSKGKKVKIRYERAGQEFETFVTPVKSQEDNKYRIGLWVRDSTAGIGTLTFFDPETRGFGALGHGITDIDTGILMPVDEGKILESNILAVRRGEQGSPGELKGVFIEDKAELGKITTNSHCGIYGVLNEEEISRIPHVLYPIGLRNQIVEGPAKILANIDGKNVEEYEILIEKISMRNYSSPKSMVIRITDERLLNVTGGIVQGMSGSPIIQNNRIVGAVTHVLVNDPTRGYGIFIEWMLNNLKSTDKAA